MKYQGTLLDADDPQCIETGFWTLQRVVDAGGFEPPAPWLQTRCSSKLS